MVESITEKKAFSLVEIVLAIAVFTIFSVGVFYLSIETIQRDSKISLDLTAMQFTEEGLEAVRNMRDKNFLLLTNGDHGLNFANDTWTFVPAPEDIDGFFSRTITIEDVDRDTNGNISAEGTFDPDTKFVTSEVSWNLRGVFPRTVTLQTILTNWSGDDWILDTCPELNQGTYDNTHAVTVTDPPPDNCDIKLETIENPGEFFSSVDIGDHANDIEVEGDFAYVSNDKHQNGLTTINISNPEIPAILSQFDIGSKSKFLHKSNNYAFMGTELNQAGLNIVDVTNPSMPVLTSQLDVEDYGNNLAVSGNYLYMGVEQEDQGLAIVDITDKSNPVLVGSMDFGDKVHAVEVSGGLAYIGVEDDHIGFRILDLSSPENPLEIGSLSVGEEVNAIALNGIFAYLGTEESTNSLQVVNIADPQNLILIGSLDVGGEIEDLVIEGDYLYAAVGNQNAGLAAVNISDPINPILSYNRDVTGKGKGIDADTQYIYLAINTNNRGVVIVGNTDSGINLSGTYTSPVFDTGSPDTRYNFIEWDHSEIPGGSIRLQIRTSDQETNMANATWVGSDGTASTFYENSRTNTVLDPQRTGQRYIQYRVYFDSDGVNSPTLKNVRINYHP